jgi:uncharacterized coiled-coil protein SlyX
MRHLLAALFATPCLLPGLAWAADYRANDSATAQTALRTVKAGDRLLLGPGTYSGLTLKYNLWKAADAPVVIRSADPAAPAVLDKFIFGGVEGLALEDVVLDATSVTGNYWAFQFTNIKGLRLSRVEVLSRLDLAQAAYGVSVRGGADVVVEDSHFRNLGRGLAIGGVEGVRVSGNTAHDLRSDGFDFAAVTNVRILNNSLRNFFPLGTDHPDAIQFFTSGTTTPSTDIVIEGNLIDIGEGRGTQGIFLRDQVGTLPYERVRIARNLILGTGWSAIRTQGVRDLTLTDNELVTFEGGLNTYILIQGGDRVLAERNRAVQISFGDSVNVTQRDNVITKPVADLGLAVKTAWLGTEPPPPPVETDPRDARIAALEAQVATLAGRVDALTAQLTAAQADRNALAARIDALLIERAKALALAKQTAEQIAKARTAKAKNQYIDAAKTFVDPLISLLSAPAP